MRRLVDHDVQFHLSVELNDPYVKLTYMKISLLKIIPLLMLLLHGCASDPAKLHFSAESSSQVDYAINEISKRVSTGLSKREVFYSLGKPERYLDYKGQVGVSKIYFYTYGQAYDKNTKIKDYMGKKIKSAVLSLGFNAREKVEWAHLQCLVADGAFTFTEYTQFLKIDLIKLF